MREEWIHQYMAEHDVPVNLLLKRATPTLALTSATLPYMVRSPIWGKELAPRLRVRP